MQPKKPSATENDEAIERGGGLGAGILGTLNTFF